MPNGRRFQISETYKSGLTINDIVTICKQKKDIFNIEKFYCDPSQPGYIEELNRNGLPAVGAVNDIRPGVDYVYELIKTRQLKLIKGSSPHTIDELETYHYPEPDDLKPDQSTKEQKPVGQNDHALDAVRYVSVMTKHIGAMRRAPINPEENKPKDAYDRLKLIRTKKRSGQGTEDWS